MIVPKALQPGDEIRIVSTARKIDSGSLKKSKLLVESLGYTCSFGQNVLADDNQFAGSTAQRVLDLQTALDDENVKAIWCSRGGYGTVKLLDYLNFSKFKEKPKWIVGYSDITALLMHVWSNFRIPCIHGTMPINAASLSHDHPSISTLFSSLKKEPATLSIPPSELNTSGTFSGTLVGGNLSMLYSILGSSSFQISEGSVLFIEDLDEYLYHIDRMFMNLKRNGVFDLLNGVLIGGLTDMNDNTVPFGLDAYQIALDHFVGLDVPVVFNVPVGHQEHNYAMTIGSSVVYKDGELSFHALG